MMNPSATTAPAPDKGGKPRNLVLLIVVGIISAYVVFNGVMLLFAMESPPTLVSQSYYEDSRGFDAQQAAEQATQAAGWRLEATPASASQVAIVLKDRAGRSASGFSGTVSAYRPNDPGLDQPLAWQEDAAQPGRYLATFAKPKAGQWQLRLALKRGGEHVNEELRIVTP